MDHSPIVDHHIPYNYNSFLNCNIATSPWWEALVLSLSTCWSAQIYTTCIFCSTVLYTVLNMGSYVKSACISWLHFNSGIDT